MRPRYDVVVVGAGPAGSATAALLAGRGARVALVDRATFPRPKPCAEYLNPAAVALLERLGVLAAVRARGPAVVRGMRIVAPSGAEATGWFGPAHGLALPREILDTVLVEHAVARGAELLDHTVADALDGSRHVTLRTSQGISRVAADLVVAADGLHSRFARHVVRHRHATSTRIALVTHYARVPGMRELGEMHVTPYGYVGIAPVGGDLVNVSVVVDRDRESPERHAAAWFDALITRVPDVAGRLAGGRRVDRVRGVGPFGRRAARAWGKRLLLVGDAAEFFDPFTGDGIWAALRGAELAANAAAAPDRLAPYGAARRRAFTGKWIVERLVSAAVGRPKLFDHIARRLARRSGLIDALVGVCGHQLPARRVLHPAFVLRLLA